MQVLKTVNMLCPCCMEEHAVQIISVLEHNVFKNESVDYSAEYFYCDQANETYANEQQMSSNDISMKNAFRKKIGLPSLDFVSFHTKAALDCMHFERVITVDESKI